MSNKNAAARQAKEKAVRTNITVGLIVTIVIVAIIGGAWAFLSSSTKTSGTTSTSSVSPSSDYAVTVGEESAPVTISIYQDYLCPYCGEFERANTEDVQALVAAGTAKVEIHVMNFLDSQSNGTNYSTRAANALVTVWKSEPEYTLAFNAALYENQPDEGSSGLTDEEMADLATGVGVSDAVAATFADQTYAGFVDGSNTAAAADGVNGTPTILINGDSFAGSQIFESGALKTAVESAAGQ